jgi:hypothetical protein
LNTLNCCWKEFSVVLRRFGSNLDSASTFAISSEDSSL